MGILYPLPVPADHSLTSPVVAVLGGGQLGRMLGVAGIPLGLRFRFLDPADEAPARAVGALVVGPLGDERALAEVAAGADAVTYEWEGVPASAARFLAERLPVRPGARSLEVTQDRLSEKTACRALGIATPAFAAVDGAADLAPAIDAVGGLPVVVKTRRGGYDGRGQLVLRDGADTDGVWAELGAVPLIVEQLVPFTRELSVLAVRAHDGAVACWPLVENHHEGGILRISRAPAPATDPRLQTRAEDIARALTTDLDHVGVLAVELFDADGELLVNELAPRVHNSGHWTIEGAETSQFENHLRAVLGLPLGSTAPRGASVMYNCIGSLPPRAAVLGVAGAHYHDYEKAPRAGRKVGHVTVTAPDPEELAARVHALQAVLA
jgi:5-(carboxyamino)imidazole ribonucleotide synthase